MPSPRLLHRRAAYAAQGWLLSAVPVERHSAPTALQLLLLLSPNATSGSCSTANDLPQASQAGQQGYVPHQRQAHHAAQQHSRGFSSCREVISMIASSPAELQAPGHQSVRLAVMQGAADSLQWVHDTTGLPW